MKKVFILSTLFLVTLFPLALSFGQIGFGQPGGLPDVPETFLGCNFATGNLSECLRNIFRNVLRYIAFFTLIAGFILIGYGGFQYVTSGSFEEPKKKIIAGIGGVIVAFLAYGLSVLIESWITRGGEY